MASTRMQTTFEAAKVIQPIFTRGSVALGRDGRILASCLDEDVVLTDLRTGDQLARIEGDGEIVTSIAVTPDTSHLIICSRSLSMRIYSIRDSETLGQSLEYDLQRTVKPHLSPVVVTAVDRTGTLLATGGADGIVKVWDVRAGYVTHTFHGHSGVISALHFFEVDAALSVDEASSNKRKRKSQSRNQDDDDKALTGSARGFRLASGGEDGKVRVWDLHKKKSAALLDSHVSVVRSLDYSPDEDLLISASRDKTAILWNSRTWKIQSTIPVLEELECAGFLEEGKYIYLGGETSRLRIWDRQANTELTGEQPAGTETEAIQQVINHPDLPFLLVAHADQTIVLYDTNPLQSAETATTIPPLPILRRICGTHGQIVDIAYVGKDKDLLALATNVEDVRIVNISTAQTHSSETNEAIDGSYFGADVALLKGHEELIICMDVDWSGHWLATGAKDNTARLWRLDPASSSYECFAVYKGHAESLGAIALSKYVPQADTPAYMNPLDHPPAFLITGSQDQTIKKWDIKKASEKAIAAKASYTRKAHDRDINALAADHRGQLFASASQDRTVKIWSVENGEAQGILRGHKRGVWSVAFSPQGLNVSIAGISGGSGSRGYVVTGSGDKTVRIWSLLDYSCLMTMEGHTNSVLKVLWLPLSQHPAEGGQTSDKRGPLVASAGGDGLVKVWEVNSGECAATLDNHEDRVWALAARPPSKSVSSRNSAGEALVSGDGSGVMTFWEDTTTATAQETRARESERIELDQKLSNYVYGGNWREAVVLALQLDQPGKLLHLFRQVVEGEDFDHTSYTGNREVDEVIASLSDTQVYKLLLRCRDWNTNARTAMIAQRVLRAIIASCPLERLSNLKIGRTARGASLREVLRGLRVFSERHFQRVANLWDESFIIEYTLNEMDDILGVDGGIGGEVNGHSDMQHNDVLMIE